MHGEIPVMNPPSNPMRATLSTSPPFIRRHPWFEAEPLADGIQHTHKKWSSSHSLLQSEPLWTPNLSWQPLEGC